MASRIEKLPGRIRIDGMLGSDDISRLSGSIEESIQAGALEIDMGACTGADLLSAVTLASIVGRQREKGNRITLLNAPSPIESVLGSLEEHCCTYLPARDTGGLRGQISEIGEKVADVLAIGSGLRSFAARTLAATMAVRRNRKLLRWHLMLYYMEQTGVRAVPIIATLCWMLGVVLGFQAGFQLRSFAAETYMPDLVAYSMTWEIAPLLAAVLVAGRSGSAFAAEIGTMKVRQEIDALRVMGMDEWSYLVTPKMLALMVVLPFLVLLADLFGLLGGLLIGGWYLGMPASVYMSRLGFVLIPLDIYWGMLKSIVYAVIIANVGCFMGMRVKGGAAEVGRATTSAVVASIFLVIVADALISLIFVHVRPTVSL